jgi:hypothetical protein
MYVVFSADKLVISNPLYASFPKHIILLHLSKKIAFMLILMGVF